MKFREVVFLVLIGILLATGGYLLYKTLSTNKRNNLLTAEIYALQHAPVKIDTIHDSIVLPGGVVIKPIPVKVIVHDTVIKKINESWYDSTFVGQGFHFRWKTKVTGSLDYITFSDFVVPKETIIIRKSIDTCYEKLPAYRPINHLGIDFDMIGSNIKQFPNLDAVFWWSIRDRVKLNAGAEYSAYHNELYGKIGVGVYLK